MRDGVYEACEAELIAEHNWLVLGRPYYKLWPGYAQMLSRTSLGIPTSVFRVPCPAFAVYLAGDAFRFDFEGRVLSLRSFLVCRSRAVARGKEVLSVVIDDGEESRSVNTLHLLEHKTIEESVPAIPELGGQPTSKDLTNTALRLAVAVSLLAVSVHRCVEHDVIAKLRERYDAATSDGERKTLAEKSEKRGVHGWRIGRGRCLALTTPHDDGASDPSGRELSYQHVRGGHFHTVRYGPGKLKIKAVFYEPTIVRRDLPPPPVSTRRVAGLDGLGLIAPAPAGG